MYVCIYIHRECFKTVCDWCWRSRLWCAEEYKEWNKACYDEVDKYEVGFGKEKKSAKAERRTKWKKKKRKLKLKVIEKEWIVNKVNANACLEEVFLKNWL